MPKIKKADIKFVCHDTPESGNIDRIGYDKKLKLVLVEFSYGGKYIYKDVPEKVYEEFKGAESVGKFLSSNIKNVYDFSKVGK
jgi:hypothetical protein